MKRNLLFLLCIALFTLSVIAQDAPEAGQKFRIANGSGLYLTCDPGYNGGNNPWFIDSLYTVPSSVSTDYTLNGTATTSVVNTNPNQQIFTLSNPDPNDPELWVIEAANGQYLSQSASYAWDVVLSPASDIAASQLFFVDQGWGIYLLQLSTRTNQYLATDNAAEGESVGKYSDGWEYLYRSTVYNDKPATQAGDQALWYFEKYNTNGINDLAADKNTITVFPTLANKTLTINVEKGTEIAVYTLTGTKVIDTVLDGKLDISSLASGVYFVTTPNGGKAKFIKQ
jgi:hypothetical protein